MFNGATQQSPQNQAEVALAAKAQAFVAADGLRVARKQDRALGAAGARGEQLRCNRCLGVTATGSTKPRRKKAPAAGPGILLQRGEKPG
jgi:hypothetical protein